jgi:hypothetical protein
MGILMPTNPWRRMRPCPVPLYDTAGAPFKIYPDPRGW